MTQELSYEAIEMNREFGPYKYPLRDRIERHLEAIENRHPWHNARSPWGPPVAPPSILGQMAMRFLDQVGPVPPGTLHAKQEIETISALRLDRQPIAYGVFTDKSEKRGRKRFTFETKWRDETGLILGTSQTVMVLPGGEQDGNKQDRRSTSSDAPRKSEFSPITRELTQDKLTIYSEDSANALRGQSIHVQPEAAKKAGFPTTVAQGLMSVDYMSEIMESELGREWYDYASLSVVFLRPVFCGDTLTAGGRLAETSKEGAMQRQVYDLWCENQAGELVTSATASVLVGLS
jgi:3-hydroxybutyryl-CoA dehydratase